MAGRIRTIKPELRELLAFASLTDGAARLFLMLYTLVDDHGRCPASPSFLMGAVFFARRTSPAGIGRLISELQAANLVATYEVNGAPFVELQGWRDKTAPTHQRIDKPQPSRYPAPKWFHSGNDSETDSETDSRTDLDHRPQTGTGTTDRDQVSAGLADLISPAPGGLKPRAGEGWETSARELVDLGGLDAVRRASDEHHAKRPGPFRSAEHFENSLASFFAAAAERIRKKAAAKAARWEKLGDPPQVPAGVSVPQGLWATPDDEGPAVWQVFEGRTFLDGTTASPWESYVAQRIKIAGRDVFVMDMARVEAPTSSMPTCVRSMLQQRGDQ